jgi:hypothetical protein
MNLHQLNDIEEELRTLGCPNFQLGCNGSEGQAFILVASTWLCKAYDECVCVAEGRENPKSEPTRDSAAATLVDLGFRDTFSSALALIDGDNSDFLQELINIVKAARSLYPPYSDLERPQDEIGPFIQQEDSDDAAAASILSRMDHVFANDYSLFSTEALTKLPLSEPLDATAASDSNLKSSNNLPQHSSASGLATALPVNPSKLTASDVAISEGDEYWRIAADKSFTKALDEVHSRRAEMLPTDTSNAQNRSNRPDQSCFQSGAIHRDATVEAMRQALDGALCASAAVKKRNHISRALAALEAAGDEDGDF